MTSTSYRDLLTLGARFELLTQSGVSAPRAVRLLEEMCARRFYGTEPEFFSGGRYVWTEADGFFIAMPDDSKLTPAKIATREGPLDQDKLAFYELHDLKTYRFALEDALAALPIPPPPEPLPMFELFQRNARWLDEATIREDALRVEQPVPPPEPVSVLVAVPPLSLALRNAALARLVAKLKRDQAMNRVKPVPQYKAIFMRVFRPHLSGRFFDEIWRDAKQAEGVKEIVRGRRPRNK